MIAATIVMVGLWIALSRRFEPASLALGAAASLGVVALQRALFPRLAPVVGSLLRRPVDLLIFAGSLLLRLALSTVHTSWLILSGRAEGRLMALPLRVSHPLGQFILLNSVTLTPSTISLLVEGDVVYVHWLQSRGKTSDWRQVVQTIERRILAIFPEVTDADH